MTELLPPPLCRKPSCSPLTQGSAASPLLAAFASRAHPDTAALQDVPLGAATALIPNEAFYKV